MKIYWLRAYYILGDDRRNSSIFTKLLQAVEDGKEEFPFTSGENKYDFIDIKDLAMEIVAASTQDEITGIIRSVRKCSIFQFNRKSLFFNECFHLIFQSNWISFFTFFKTKQ